MTGRAYRKSAEIAGRMGPFAGYRPNAAAMLGVIAKHRAAVGNIAGRTRCRPTCSTAARKAWDDALDLGEVNGYRNAQATVLAPTGCLVGDSLVSTEPRARSAPQPRRPCRPEVAGPRPRGRRPTKARGRRRSSTSTASSRSSSSRRAAATGSRERRRTGSRSSTANGNWVWRRFGRDRARRPRAAHARTARGRAADVELPPLGELHWNARLAAPACRVTMNADLAELVGYFMGDGSLHAKGLRFCVANGDVDVVERLAELAKALFGLDAARHAAEGYMEVAFHSVPLTSGGRRAASRSCRPPPSTAARAGSPHIPDAVLHTNDRDDLRLVRAWSLRGRRDDEQRLRLVEHGRPSSFSRDVQSLLLALGFVTTRKIDGTGSNWGNHERFVLRLLERRRGRRFLEEIGFISDRKRGSARRRPPAGVAARPHSGQPRADRRARAGERLAPQDDADGARPPRRCLSPLGDRAPRASRDARARASARLLLRHGRDGRGARRPADLRPLGSRERDVRGQRLRQPQHDQLHDGLRHDRRRARLLARQVEEARRRRRDHDREQDRAARAREARLRAERDRRDRRVRRRAQHRRRRAVREGRALPGLRLRDRRAGRPLRRPREDDGRDPAVHLGRDLEDREPAGDRRPSTTSRRSTSTRGSSA